MKPGSIADPDFYLGNKLKMTTLPNGVHAWGMSSSKYVQEAVINIDKYLTSGQLGEKRLQKQVRSQWPSGYIPELDTSDELNDKDANFCQHLIGVPHWIVELGRVDIITEVSLLSAYLAAPCDCS